MGKTEGRVGSDVLHYDGSEWWQVASCCAPLGSI